MNFQKIEKKWQKTWGKEGVYKVKDKVRGKKNFYHLVMFPYPSGDLHIGHWYNFAPADVFARFKRMRGFNVLSPIGFDAFGLPAENAAIKRGIHPKDWTYKNIKTMTAQLENMGNMYDWSRKIITAEPDYYKWTQWMFLQLYKKGLVYKKKASANWCPKCHTVLANEQVIDGKCERCDSQVIQREIEQWLFKITDYAERLLKDLDGLDWPEKTKTMQRNWIGKSDGAIIKFQIPNSKFQIPVFTTRLDTIFGCTYLVIAPENPIIENLKSQILNWKEVENYIKQTNEKTELQRLEIDKQKTGIELKSIKALNPFNNEEVPVYVADYVLGHYGTGAVMAVPAHDERDFDFAKKYNLSIRQVIQSTANVQQPIILPFIEDGILVESGQFTGLKSSEAREKMTQWLEKNNLGNRKINYKLRDWLVSRQRYWGTPIPMIYCDKCGIAPVSEKDLPVKLPNIKNYLPTEEGKSPLAHSEKFINAKCPKCNGKAKRETDTMDTFVCSSWYYLRYTDPKNSKKFADAKKIKNWLPVDMYIGGAEHSVLHLLYARFFTKVLYDLKYLDFKEPFSALRHQGTILGADGQKMSKSRGNVIDPDGLVKKFGSDCVKMYFCFMGPYDQGGPWNPGGILGMKRLLERIEYYFKKREEYKKSFNNKIPSSAGYLRIQKKLHQAIKKIGEDIEKLKFNTAIAELSILMSIFSEHYIDKLKNDVAWSYLKDDDANTFLKLLAPFAPHLAEELWHQLGNKKSIHLEQWPKYNPDLIKEKQFELVVQINGKIRDKINANSGINQKEAEELVLSQEKIKAIIGEGKIKKVIFIPNKLINIVV